MGRWQSWCALVACGILAGAAQAQSGPAPDAACVVNAGNRSAPLAADGSYAIYNIPGNTGAIRARAVCSDGSIGQSAVGFTDPLQPATVELGPITWGQIDPVPVAATLSAPQRRLVGGQDSQLAVLATALDGSTRDVTPRSEGTTYSISNSLLAAVGENGLVHIFAEFAPGASARLVASATVEGSVSATFVYTLGPRGRLTGDVRRADGTTPVAGAQVSVLRLQPMEQAGTAVTDLSGHFALEDVDAGSFIVSAIEPVSGDRALGSAHIGTEGEVADVSLRLNGLGQVDVSVVDAADATVSGAIVTYTALGAYREARTLPTNAQGVASFIGVPAGDFTVSTRDPATRLVGTAVATLAPGQTLSLTLRLQPIGSVHGVVRDIDGTTPRADVQVRILSRARGLLTQSVTAADGAFAFDTLPIADGPFTLDAFVDGRLRARVPGVVIPHANDDVLQDVVLGAVGTVSGHVRDGAGSGLGGAHVTLQMQSGLRQTFDADADAQGAFFFPAVPLGPFALTASSGPRNGQAAGSVDNDGDAVQRDVIIAGNTVHGVVYLRDGATPAGAGIDVYFAPGSAGAPYSFAGVPGVAHTVTGAGGEFQFDVGQAGTYLLQAEQALERGRTPLAVANLDGSQALEAKVVFLAKGLVDGTVRDPNGVPQADVPVLLRSEGAFGTQRDTRTDGMGHYAFDGVFVGDVFAQATNEATHLSGVSGNRLDAEGQHLVLDVTLTGTGSVHGRVLARDGSVVPDAVHLSVRRGGAPVADLTLPDGSAYSVDGVPIGDVEVSAERVADGDRGIATTRIATPNESKALDVRLVGLGRLHVVVQDEHGAPVAGAQISVRNAAPFYTSQSGVSDADGGALFEHTFAGDLSVSASKPSANGSLSGTGSATLVAYGDATVTITLVDRPVGRVHGVVVLPDGSTPAGAGLVVRMQPEPFRDAFVATTDAQGAFAFENVAVGAYSLDVLRFYTPSACPARDRIRARGNVTLAGSGDDAAATLQLIGQGEVSGTVTLPGGAPAPGIAIRLTNPDPVYGANVTCGNRTTYDTTTDANGHYQFGDIPPGNFTLTANDAAQTLRAEGRGQVRFDGDAAVLDLVLVDSAIGMPHTLYDANGFKFDLAGTGAIATGTGNVFAGSGPDNAGMRLLIVKDGVAVPFANGDGSVGRLSKDGQQVEVDEDDSAGLHVTRRIYTPRAGYFTRYIEVLQNPGATPVTVDVRVLSHHRGADGNPRVVDSSDGDQVLSVIDAQQRDRWVVVDDQQDADPFTTSPMPATGHLFDGVGGAMQVASADYSLIGQTGRLSYEWRGVSVPAGGQVALLHFVFHQTDRARARTAALRLAQLPPEALDDLTTDERQAIRNFAVPEQSAVEPLPNLGAGIVHGVVLSGDGTSPVPGAIVRFQSHYPLFGRARTAVADAQGQFQLQSRLDGTAENAVIPIYAFELSATHPVSGAATAVAQGDFAPDTSSVRQDLIFVGTGNVRGTVKRHNGALVADALVRLCLIPDRGLCWNTQYGLVNRGASAADGRYALFGNPPHDYYLFADQEHPQGDAIYGAATVRVTAGDVTVSDIAMEPTGSIGGVVRSSDGTPVVNAPVTLDFDDGTLRRRSTTSDTAGRFHFSDVPVGTRRLHAVDPLSGAGGDASASVAVDSETNQDIAIAEFGTLTVHVEFARGGAAAGAPVAVSGHGIVYADANGAARFQLAQGSYGVTAYHPDYASATTSASASVSVTQQGQQLDVTLRLGPAGTVHGTIVRPDGTTLAGGFPFVIVPDSGRSEDRRSGSTDGSGLYRVAGLAVGGYHLTAYDAAQDRFAEGDFHLDADGDEVQLDLTLLANRIALPANLLDANRFVFDVQRSGALSEGSGAFAGAAAQLWIDGQAVSGDSSAHLEADRRQFAIAQPTPLAGLSVTRKIYVPYGAYFARYVDVLDNPGATPVSVDVALIDQFAGDRVLGTSSGDAAVDAGDAWVTVDDADDSDVLITGSAPATAHLFAGAGATRPPNLVEWDASGTAPRLTPRWDALTVPAHGRVALMHFVVQQVNRRGVQAAVERLSQLPPEALADLDPADAAAVVNIALPPGGVSTLPALPALTAQVDGIVYEGDGRTPVPGAAVTVQSDHPLFNRVWGMRPDPYFCPPGTPLQSLRSVTSVPPNVPNAPPLGQYSLIGQLSPTASVALPEGSSVRVTVQEARSCFYGASGHPLTHIPSRAPSATATATQDVLFDSGIFTGHIEGAPDFQVTQGRLYRSIDDPDDPVYLYVPIRGDGSYVFPGVAPGRYDLLFDTPHPQSGPTDRGLRGQLKQVQIAAGQVLVTDVPLQPTGQVQGTLLTATGEAAVHADVTLRGDAAGQDYDQCADGCDAATLSKHTGKRDVWRTVQSDSLGRFAFATVPTGQYSLSAVDPASAAVRAVPLTVSAGAPVVQNLTLWPLGTIQLDVRTAAGQGVADAYVYLDADAVGHEAIAGHTDPAGHLTIANVPQGHYRVRVIDPRFAQDSTMERSAEGSIDAQGEVDSVLVTLKVRASLHLGLFDAAAAGAPVNDAQVRYRLAGDAILHNVGYTGTDGYLALQRLDEGDYLYTAYAPDGRSAATEVVVDASVDGSVIERPLSLVGTPDLLGAFHFQGEQHLAGVSVSAGSHIAVHIGGAAVGQAPGNCALHADVYNPNRGFMASGYAYQPDQVYNQSGNLADIVAPVDGFYTVHLRAQNDWCLGGYRLGIDVDGAPTLPVGYEGGTTVSGRLYRADGATPVAGASVRLRTDDVPQLHVEQITAADGAYSFERVPLSAFTLYALPASSGAPAASATGHTVDAGTPVLLDLVQQAATTLDLQVVHGDGSHYQAELSASFEGDGGVQYANTDGDGHVVQTVLSGTPIRVRVTDYSTGDSAETSVPTADGQTVPVNLVLGASSLGGRVLGPDGQPRPNALVRARRHGSASYDFGYRNADADGVFDFGAIPAGTDVDLLASDPADNVGVSVRATVAAGTPTLRDLSLPARGSVAGTVKTTWGAPLANAFVTLRYDQFVGDAYQLYAYAQTAEDGRFRFDGVPIDRPFTIVTTLDYNWGSFGTDESQGSIAQAGDVVTIDQVISIPGGRVSVNMAAADGVARDEYCEVQVGEHYDYGRCDRFVFDGIPAGPTHVRAQVSNDGPPGPVLGEADVTVIDEQNVDVDFRDSVVRGTVRYADGAAVPYPDVMLSDSNGQTYQQQGDDSGVYRVVGVPVGPFFITAQDASSGLAVDGGGTLADLAVPVVLDLTLPATASVGGTVSDQNAQPVAAATVYARSDDAQFDLTTTTDDAGAYSFPLIGAGPVTLSALHPQDRNVASASVVLAPQQQATVDLQFGPTGSVQGQVTDAAQAPIGTACVVLWSPLEVRAYWDSYQYADADASGHYVLPTVPAGPYRIAGGDCSNADIADAGLTEGAAPAQTVTTQDVAVGNAVWLSHPVEEPAAGYHYDLDYDASLAMRDLDNGDSPMAYAGRLNLNGEDFSYESAAYTEGDGHHLRYGPVMRAGLEVSRRVAVPDGAGYVRTLEVLHNPGPTDISVSVVVRGQRQDYHSVLAVAAPSTGGRYAAHADPAAVVEGPVYTNGTSAYVFGGSGGSLPATQIRDGEPDLQWRWTVVVPAGATRSFLHYLVVRTTPRSQEALDQAARLADMSEPGMFDGLDAADRAAIQNFVVNP